MDFKRNLEDRYLATRVAALAIGSSIWLFVSISLSLLPWPDALLGQHKIDWLWMSIDITWLLLGIVAAVLMYRALAAFQRGVDGQLWDRPSLDKLQSQIDHPAISLAIWAGAFGAISCLIFNIVSRHHGNGHHSPGMGGLAYFWMSPLTAVTTLRRTLKPKLLSRQSVWRDDIKPIVSEHWGNRGPASS